MFRERTGALRKILKRDAELFYMSAPHVIPEEINLTRPPDQQEKGWWFSKSDKSYFALDNNDTCIGYDDSLKAVSDMVATHGPFDGVLGFSQGACFVSLLCAHQQTNSSSTFRFKFAILFAGFRSLLSPHAHLYSVPISLPTFHSIGETDGVIPSEASKQLVELFPGAVSYQHGGGHYIPASSALRAAMQDFLKPFLSQQ